MLLLSRCEQTNWEKKKKQTVDKSFMSYIELFQFFFFLSRCVCEKQREQSTKKASTENSFNEKLTSQVIFPEDKKEKLTTTNEKKNNFNFTYKPIC